MAKIKFTSTVSEIRGKIRGDVIKGYKGGFALQDIARIPSRSSQAQQLTRATVAYFSSKWSTLSAGRRLLWNEYGAMMTPPKSGQSLYIAYNVALITARHSSLIEVAEPPAEPGIPGLPAYAIINAEDSDGNFVVDKEDAKQFWVYWHYLATDEAFVKHYFSYLIGYRSRGKERWRFSNTSEYERQFTVIPLTEFEKYARRIRGKTIDPYGRVSAYSYIEAEFPMANLLLEDCEDTETWVATNLVLGLGIPYVHGAASLVCHSEGLVKNQWLKHSFPDPQAFDLYRYLNFFCRSTLGNLGPPTVETKIKLVDNVGQEIWLALGIPPTYWNWYHVDIYEPDVQNPNFNYHMVQELWFYFNVLEQVDPYDFHLDFFYLSK